MSRGDKLLKASKGATGDDSIIDAAEFMPKEAAQGAVAGAAAGTVLADAKGLAARTFLGREIGARKTELPKHIALVVTPVQAHLLGVPKGFWSEKSEDAYLITSVNRSDIEVSIKSHFADRLLTITHIESGDKLELAADKISHYHAKAVIELLQMGPGHQEDLPAEE